jgi:hypothetical protein
MMLFLQNVQDDLQKHFIGNIEAISLLTLIFTAFLISRPCSVATFAINKLTTVSLAWTALSSM